ncbi:unnamed protein product [Porites evermanni]|uniref:RRM domain-containing protein n=1 Tax=Porites evermanni TaxID=104178 RepID=A0ABN8M3D4_9CNID|nr:unnamed protein product [Porites evermanni]
MGRKSRCRDYDGMFFFLKRASSGQSHKCRLTWVVVALYTARICEFFIEHLCSGLWSGSFSVFPPPPIPIFLPSTWKKLSLTVKTDDVTKGRKDVDPHGRLQAVQEPVLVILQQTSPTNFQFWCSFGKVQIMCQKCLKKTDSEKHLGQSVHECIGLAMDSITLLFFIISSTQDYALVMLGSPSQLTSTLVPGISAPPPTVPTMPDRVVIHPDATNNTPVPPQEQPPQQQQQSSGVPQPGVAQAPSSVNHTAPVKNRLGFPRKFSDTLELKRIPRDLNNIAKLNEHFQRFGSITNIQVCAFGDPEAALVQFSHHSEAKAAHSCPDAVLGNRFIRVFWHNPDRQQNNKDGHSNQGATASSGNTESVKTESTTTEDANKVITACKESKRFLTALFTDMQILKFKSQLTIVFFAAVNHLNGPLRKQNFTLMEPKAKPTMFQSGKTTFSKTSKVSPVLVPTGPPMIKRQQELQKQEAIKKKLEIQKQKQELLNKQIKEQKLLISKLEKKNLSAAEKDMIVKTVKSLSSNIEALKKEVELAAMAAKSKESPSQARQIAQKAILDQELDLITHQNTGEDTTELKKKVEELKQEQCSSTFKQCIVVHGKISWLTGSTHKGTRKRSCKRTWQRNTSEKQTTSKNNTGVDKRQCFIRPSTKADQCWRNND